VSTPPVPEPDDKDWTWVLDQPCAECGYVAGAVVLADLPALIVEASIRLADAVRQPGSAVRDHPQTWSALEYGAHVRDVCRIFDGRVQLMLTEDDPLFANWDQDATAIEGQYWAQDPATVADELQMSAHVMAHTVAAIADEAWLRPGRRSNGSVFTVDSLARYFLHDLVHHAHDVGV
jgi:hypothetical protein